MSTGTVRVGTVGWAHRHWRGLLYPDSLGEKAWLAHHAGEFDCVDAANRELPDERTLDRWRIALGDGFELCLRAPRELTHLRRLSRREPLLDPLAHAVERLGTRAGPTIFELPGAWRASPTRLADFLARLPREQRHAFVCHHPSWYEDEPLALLAHHGCALLLHDHPDAPPPVTDTADFVVVRLHGDPAATRGNYRSQALAGWARRAHGWSRRGKDVYFLFADDADGHAVKHARRLRRILDQPLTIADSVAAAGGRDPL